MKSWKISNSHPKCVKPCRDYPRRQFFLAVLLCLFNTKNRKKELWNRGNKKRIKIERRIKWEKRNAISLQMCQALPWLPQHLIVCFVCIVCPPNNNEANDERETWIKKKIIYIYIINTLVVRFCVLSVFSAKSEILNVHQKC